MDDTSPPPAEVATQALSCKLTSPELQQRKATVLAQLKTKVLDRQELANGFAYQFAGTDGMLDALLSFIKTERQCCDFFTFALTVGREGQPVGLEITGPEGAKDMIRHELGL